MTTVSNKPGLCLYNITDNCPILTTNTQGLHSIASLVKLMSVMVLLDDNINLDEQVELDVTSLHHSRNLEKWPWESRPARIVKGVDQADILSDSTHVPCFLDPGVYTNHELLLATLITSENYATETLAKNYSQGPKKFVEHMNKKAHELGMVNTVFANSHGCKAVEPDSYSTIEDVNILLIESAKYELISKYTTYLTHQMHNTTLTNTNYSALTKYHNVIDKFLVSKTAFSDTSGYSVIVLFEHKNKKYSLVLLGLPSRDIRTATFDKLITKVL